MKKIVLYLDIDGVLFDDKGFREIDKLILNHQLPIEMLLFQEWINSEEILLNHFHRVKQRTKVHHFSKEALANLDQLIKILQQQGYEVQIAVSSNWRTWGDVEFLQDLFSPHDFHRHVADKVPDHDGRDNYERGSMIKEHFADYLKADPDTKILILDDIDLGISSEFPNGEFIHCKNLFLQDEFNRALKTLNINIEPSIADEKTAPTKPEMEKSENKPATDFQAHTALMEENIIAWIKSYQTYESLLKQKKYSGQQAIVDEFLPIVDACIDFYCMILDKLNELLSAIKQKNASSSSTYDPDNRNNTFKPGPSSDPSSNNNNNDSSQTATNSPPSTLEM